MSFEPGTFLFLSSTAWSAISSLATVSAVIVALFLPMYLERKRKNNLMKLVEHEIQMNIGYLRKAISVQDTNLKGNRMSRLDQMCQILSHIYLGVWKYNKQTVAELSAINYMKFSEIVYSLELIRSYAVEIDTSKEESLCLYVVESEIERCIQLSEMA